MVVVGGVGDGVGGAVGDDVVGGVGAGVGAGVGGGVGGGLVGGCWMIGGTGYIPKILKFSGKTSRNWWL